MVPLIGIGTGYRCSHPNALLALNNEGSVGDFSATEVDDSQNLVVIAENQRVIPCCSVDREEFPKFCRNDSSDLLFPFWSGLRLQDPVGRQR